MNTQNQNKTTATESSTHLESNPQSRIPNLSAVALAKANPASSPRTRTGKIARLPHQLREQLNQRLRDAEEARDLVAWLNSLPEVQNLLTDKFQGRPISEQNMSDWKSGGYRDWLRQQQACEMAERLTLRAQQLNISSVGVGMADNLAALVAMELATVMETLMDEIDDPKERWEQLRKLLPELTQLRREDQRAVKTRIAREKWEAQKQEKQIEQKEKQLAIAKEKATPEYWKTMEVVTLADLMGGDDRSRMMAATVVALIEDVDRDRRAEAMRHQHAQDMTDLTQAYSSLLKEETKAAA